MLSKLSVKKPYTVIVGIILAIVLGYISFQRMSTDLLPSMNLPYVVVYTPYTGATPELVETEVTRPMESAFATLTDIKKLTSQSRDNVSVVIMQFNDGANMDTALIEISSRLDQLKGTWADDVGAPVAMKLNPDMLPVAILSVSRSDMDIMELSDYVNDELVPGFEALNGVASATASGVIEQEIDVTIEQSRIDVVNSAVLRDIDAKLADVEAELNEAQAKISDGKRQLARGREEAEAQLAAAEAQIAAGEAQIGPAVQELTGKREELATQRTALNQNVIAMEAAMGMTDEQKAQVQTTAAQLAEMKQQKTQLEALMAAAQAGSDTPEETLAAQRQDAVTQRDGLIAQRDSLKAYIDDLNTLDADALNAEISRLSGEIAESEALLAAQQEALGEAETRRDALKTRVDELTARMTADNTDAPSPSPETSPSVEPSESPEASPSVEPSESPEASPSVEPSESPEASLSVEPSESPEASPSADSEASAGPETSPEAVPGNEDSVTPENMPAPSDEADAGEPSHEETPAKGESGSSDETPADGESGSSDETLANGEGGSTDEPPADGESGSSDETPADGESGSTDESAANGESGSSDESAADGEGGSTEESSADGENSSSDESAADAENASSDESANDTDDGSARESDDSDPSHESSSNDSGSSDESASGGDDPSGADGSGSDGSARAAWNRALAEGDESPEALKAQLEDAAAQLAEAEAEVARRSAEVEETRKALDALREQLSEKQSALEAVSGAGGDMSSRLQEAEAEIAALDGRIAALDQEIADYDTKIAATQVDTTQLQEQVTALDQQIQSIQSTGVEEMAALLEDDEGLAGKYTEARNGLAEMNAGITQMDAYLEKLNSNIIPGGMIPGMDEDTDLTAARAALNAGAEEMEAALSAAESMLNKAQREIGKARKEFMEKRDEAYEDAGIDGIITVETVARILGAQNMGMPAGYVKKTDGDNVLVRVGNKFGSVDEMKRLKLFSLDLDTIDNVYLMDVADVKLADDREDVFTKLDGKDGVLLSLEKQSTYSTADVAKTVINYAKQLQQEHPELQIVDLMNQGEYIEIVVQSVLNNLLSGGGLAILVLLLFLLDLRPTLTVAFSIPISVVIAFVAMYFSGITLNVLSLSGLSLGIGMLVDNSIVSIENIYRLHDEEGYPLLRACVEGVRSVSGALASSTLTTICVFLPIVFVKGMARDLFADMGLTIAYSLLASLMVAMTVVPMMSSFLMRHSKPRRHSVFSKFQAAYGAMLRGALRFKPLVLLAAVALLAFSGMQVTKMGISFMPEVNSRQMSADLQPSKKLSTAEQKAQAAEILGEMMELPGIKSIGLMDAGSRSVLASGDGYSYYIIVDETAGVRNVDLARQIEAIGERHNADLTAQASTMDISMMTGDGISAEITGDDIDTLQKIAKDIAAIAEATEGTRDVSDGLEEAMPEVRIEVDKAKATEESLTVGQVYQFIAQKLLEKTEISKVTLDGREMSIQLIDGRNRDIRPAMIQDLEIEVEKEDEDVFVRIGDIAKISDATSLATIGRSSQRRMVAVSFSIAEGYSANHVSDAFAEKLKEYQLPDGYHVELTGENETVMGIMEDLMFLIAVAVLLIFLIMVAQFQSFKSPIIVMFTIPLAFTGGLIALLLTHMDLSIVAMLGFLVLSGVVVNNGIVFIDCVNQLRIEGMEKRAALVEAGRQRLRPILMTAMTTILGMSTMALGRGTGAEMMQPMAVVSIGGLSYATLMTLFVVPVLYDLFNGREMKAREIQMIREAAGMNGDEVLDDRPAPAAREDAPASPRPRPAPAGPRAKAAPEPPVPVFAPPPSAPRKPPTPSPASKPARLTFRLEPPAPPETKPGPPKKQTT